MQEDCQGHVNCLRVDGNSADHRETDLVTRELMGCLSREGSRVFGKVVADRDGGSMLEKRRESHTQATDSGDTSRNSYVW